MEFVIAFLILLNILDCHGIDLEKQLEHMAEIQLRNVGIYKGGNKKKDSDAYRRFFSFHPGQNSVILGAPRIPSHLPEAEPILPGHTLIRPALGMLKSSVKYPHKEMANGAGVYGNMDNLGITWDGTSHRVLYSGFRRTGRDSDEFEESQSKPIGIILAFKKEPRKRFGKAHQRGLKEKRPIEKSILRYPKVR
ncbi:uncharacterized protein LOC142986183 [Anticarsia gemmatalis]|uniref:uncharacterized protein LOC142986183 n=1 Tax=Anticarsia gemmatalis TaxID=129554 RepID=UPI003F769341